MTKEEASYNAAHVTGVNSGFFDLVDTNLGATISGKCFVGRPQDSKLSKGLARRYSASDPTNSRIPTTPPRRSSHSS
jgi:hypothetical protein